MSFEGLVIDLSTWTSAFYRFFNLAIAASNARTASYNFSLPNAAFYLSFCFS